MSPRSDEFMELARGRAAAAQVLLDSGHLDAAVSAAYYAMLYAARGALSEHDVSARTHGGTWHLFHDRFVATGAFDAKLHSMAHGAQRTREECDYDAVVPSRAAAEALVAGADEFIAAVLFMLDLPA
jgi:uncharacterized protein (UPF0332 family)